MGKERGSKRKEQVKVREEAQEGEGSGCSRGDRRRRV